MFKDLTWKIKKTGKNLNVANKLKTRKRTKINVDRETKNLKLENLKNYGKQKN